MAGNLLQIVYISRAAPSVRDEDVGDICRVARRRNQECGITGLLLFDGKRFIQALEGPPDEIRRTMDRIRADHRHIHIDVASSKETDRRQFGDWSMQARRTPDGLCSVPFLRKVKEAMKGVDDVALQALFIGFTVMSTSARSGA